MKPAPFEYIRAETVLQAQEWLAADPEARIIAGGQTLMPMLAMRLVRPTRVIDIAGIAGLDEIEVTAGHVTLGAMVRQVAVERSAALAQALPLLSKAIRFVGHPPTRRRGTIGGSVANADPAAEIALVAVTLGAEVLTTADSFAAGDFFLAPMTTALPAGAMVTGLRFPRVATARRGTGFAEVAMRQGDYAMAAAACELVLDADGEVASLRLGIGAGLAGTGRADARRDCRRAGAAGDDARPQCRRGLSAARGTGAGDAGTGRSAARGDGVKLVLNVNGTARVLELEDRTSLLDALRDGVGLKGTHAGCEHGVCGTCTVLLDGEAVRSCLLLAAQAEGHAVTTIEGVTPGPGELSIVQDSFVETHGMQCGYCTPGMVLTAVALLRDNPAPTRDEIVEAISGNLCRCTGYGQIVEAIALAAERLQRSNTP